MQHETDNVRHAVPGVFAEMVDRKSQFDTLRIGIFNAVRRRRCSDYITETVNMPIGGKGKRIFARTQKGINQLTGNPFELKYGLLQKLPGVAPFMVTLRSERRTLTYAETALTLMGIFRSGFRPQISTAELAFDISCFDLEQLQSAVIARSSRRWERNTLYCGAPRSPWKLKIYDKGQGVSRLEFTFSRRYLAQLQIRRPDELLRLNRFPLTRLTHFTCCDRVRLNRASTRFPARQRRLLEDWPDSRPMQLLCEFLKDEPALKTKVIKTSPIHSLLSAMQARLLW